VQRPSLFLEKKRRNLDYPGEKTQMGGQKKGRWKGGVDTNRFPTKDTGRKILQTVNPFGGGRGRR